jgi:hypothetical protein
MVTKKAFFIFPERVEFIKLVGSLSGQLLNNNVSMVVLLDEHETNVKKDRIANIAFKNLSEYSSKTALGILKQEKPCLVVTDNDQEPIRGAFVLAANKLGIPVLILREMVISAKPKFDQIFILVSRKMGELPRIASKYLFCFRSILEISPTFFLDPLEVSNRLIDHLSNPTAGEFADYILTNTEDDSKLLRKLCGRPRFIRAIGDPRFDSVANQTLSERTSIREKIRKLFGIPTNKRIILFLSSSQVEHGMWSLEKKKQVNTNILDSLTEFKDDIYVIVKLHPIEKNIFSSIWKANYENFIHVTNSNLNELIAASDLVITWVSTAMLNVVLSNTPLIVIDFFNDGLTGGVLLSTQAIVDKGAAIEAINITELRASISKILTDNNYMKSLLERQEAFRKDYLKAIDGKSIDKISKTVLEIIK